MRRIHWFLVVCAPALLLVLVRMSLGQTGSQGTRAASTPPVRVTPAPGGLELREQPLALPARAQPAAAADEPTVAATDDAADPWALPESDPRRGLVDAFRGMNDDTTPADAERQYLAALERTGTSSEAWTQAARTTAQTWFAGLDARVTCFEGGCAATLTARDAGALADARTRITQQATHAGWPGPVITAPVVAEADGQQRQMWIFVRPE
jgi:hypothetical protein